MGTRKPLRPRLEILEMKTVLSAGVSTAPAAALAHFTARPMAIVETEHHGTPTESRASLLAARSDAGIALNGSADGDYTSKQRGSHAATEYRLTTAGTITPVGQAVVTGSFRTPPSVRGGETLGTLKIVGSSGTLNLTLKVPPPIPVTGGPVILANDFTYTIKKGTRAYAGDYGTGMVEFTTTPGIATPPGTGIDASRAVTESGFGRVTLTFETGPIPL
jgi:hypothetical protein